MASIVSLLAPGGGTKKSSSPSWPGGSPPSSYYRAMSLQTQIPLVAQSFSHASQNPYDWSKPFMGLALGRMMGEYSSALQQTGQDVAEAQAGIRQKWAQALQADPDLVKNPAKLIQTAMQIDPDFIDRFKLALETSKLAHETSRIEELTPAEKALKEAQTFQAGASGYEHLAGAGLKTEQAATAGALRGPEVRLKGAQAGKYEAEAEKTRAEIPLLGRESKYRVPASTYGTVKDALIAHFWPLAQKNIPPELQANASMLLSDPMTGAPNEAKVRAFLPTEMQRQYDTIKMQAEKNVAAGMAPQEAVLEAMKAAGVSGVPSFRPPVQFK
ncbi:MAG: hypothetical protein WHT06_16195 [Desulfobacterales bacterium]